MIPNEGAKPGVIGATILTRTGIYFDYERPDLSVIDPVDIATGLSHVCRFAGQCPEFYSVAQHCVIASEEVPAEDAFAALMHDAAEAYTGDCPSPLKQLLPDFKAIEKRVEGAIAARFGLTLPWPPSVKHVDYRLLRTERRDIMPAKGGDWPRLAEFPLLDRVIRPWNSDHAAGEWLNRFYRLCPAEFLA